jgi:hypothetical protein
MVFWRSTSSFAVLLRVSRSPSRITPRAVTTAAPSLHPVQSGPPTSAPRDEGDHDPDIDLITLRRRSKLNDTSSKASTGVDHDHRKSDTAAAPSRDSPDATSPIINVPPHPAAPELQKPDSKASKLQSHLDGLAKAIDESNPQRPTSTSKDKLRVSLKPKEDSRSNYRSRKEGILDPYLVSYLKSLQSDPSKMQKDTATRDGNRSKQDLDIDTLRPSDIRATYTTQKRKLHSEKEAIDMKSAVSVSGEPTVVPEHLIHAGLQHLNLPTSGGKVVIPRTMLVRLIEQTINLSGAAVSGDDVVIERYSPTWHRFARLLRTSDLHKISALKPPDTSSPKPPPNPSTEQPQETTTGSLPSMDTGTTHQTKPPSEVDALQSTPRFTEREYVVLALDAKKKRVVNTRFRRLLDGSSNISPPSSESFLKVESLDRY